VWLEVDSSQQFFLFVHDVFCNSVEICLYLHHRKIFFIIIHLHVCDADETGWNHSYKNRRVLDKSLLVVVVCFLCVLAILEIR